MAKDIRIFEVIATTYYDYKGKYIKLHKGTTLFGGLPTSSYPSLIEYSTCYGGRRIWFSRDVVERNQGQFRELFKD